MFGFRNKYPNRLPTNSVGCEDGNYEEALRKTDPHETYARTSQAQTRSFCQRGRSTREGLSEQDVPAARREEIRVICGYIDKGFLLGHPWDVRFYYLVRGQEAAF